MHLWMHDDCIWLWRVNVVYYVCLGPWGLYLAVEDKYGDCIWLWKLGSHDEYIWLWKLGSHDDYIWLWGINIVYYVCLSSWWLYLAVEGKYGDCIWLWKLGSHGDCIWFWKVDGVYYVFVNSRLYLGRWSILCLCEFMVIVFGFGR